MSLDKSNENDSFTKPSQSYDVKLRPKKDIDFKKISPELLKRIEALDPNDESDEDFIPDDDDDSLNVSRGSDDDDNEDEDETDVDCDDDDDNNNNSFDENKDSLSNKTTENDLSLESKDENIKLKNGKHKMSSEISNGVTNTKKLRKSFQSDKNFGEQKTLETKIKNVKTKPKKRKQKIIKKNFESDEETQKLMRSFKYSKIVRKEKKSVNNSISKAHLNGSNFKQENNPEQGKTVSLNTGPYAKISEQRIQLKNSKDTITYPIYLVCQHSSTTNSVNKLNDELNNHLNRKKLVIKESISPIIDKNSIWICALCNNKPNQINGIGELFGPYRVSLNLEEDLMYEKNNSEHLKSEFKEVWLHSGCAIWSPNIILENNRIIGIASVIKSSMNLNCVLCNKSGATLICRKKSCKKMYHFPCAIQSGCSFDRENFSISCKLHNLNGA